MKSPKASTQTGRILVEALAFLALIMLITPMIFKKTVDKNLELEDSILAAQMRTLRNATGNFIANNYEAIAAGGSVGGLSFANDKVSLTLNEAELKPYLPEGFKNKNKLGGDYRVIINRKDIQLGGETKQQISAIVVGSPSGNAQLTNRRGSRISSMIGLDGGYIPVDGFGGQGSTVAIGGEGLWKLDTKDYDPNIGTGRVIASTVIVGGQSTTTPTDGAQFLWQTEDPTNDPQGLRNRMAAEMSLGGNTIKWMDQLKSWETYDEQFKDIAKYTDMGQDIVVVKGTTKGTDDTHYNLSISDTSLLKDVSLGAMGGASLSDLLPPLSLKKILTATSNTTLNVPAPGYNASFSAITTEPKCPVGYAPVVLVIPNIAGTISNNATAQATVVRQGSATETTGWKVTFANTGGGAAHVYCRFIPEAFTGLN